MCELDFDFEEINWEEMGDYRLDAVSMECETLVDLLEIIGRKHQIKFLECMIYHGCDDCFVQMQCSDRKLLCTVLRFELRDEMSLDYDSSAGIVRGCLENLECASVSLSAEAACTLSEMIRYIWYQDRTRNTWRKISNKNGVVTLQLER